MKQPLITGVGEILWDKLPEGKKIGGAPLNFVYHALKNGAEGYVVSAIGRDVLGEELVSMIEKLGVGLKCLQNAYPTGVVDVALDDKGVAQYEIIENVAWDYISVDEETKALLRKSDCVCFGTLAQRNTISKKAIYALLKEVPSSAIKFCDINLRQHYYDKETLDSSMRAATILKINDEELAVVRDLFGLPGHEDAAVRALQSAYDLDHVVLTCGAAYSKVYVRSGEVSCIDTPKVKVVDTIGAGDSFGGTFVVSLLQGCDYMEAHRRAVEVSAWVCTQAGALPGY